MTSYAGGARTYGGALRKLNAQLKEIEPNLQKEFKAEMKDVVTKAAFRIGLRFPFRTGRASRSVKAGQTTSATYIKMGGSYAPYAPWLDFGGVLKPTGDRHNMQSREVIAGGRYLYPGIADTRKEVEKEMGKVIDRAAKRSGFNQL